MSRSYAPVWDKHKVNPGLFKQDVAIADTTANIKLTLWQNNTDHLEKGKSYRYQPDNLEVKSTKYLSPPKTGLCSTSRADIGEVMWADTCSLTVEIPDAVVVQWSKWSLELQNMQQMWRTNVNMNDTIGIHSKSVFSGAKDQQTSLGTVCEAGNGWSWCIPLQHSRYLYSIQNTIRINTEYDTIDETTTAERIMTICRNPSPAHMHHWSTLWWQT